MDLVEIKKFEHRPTGHCKAYLEGNIKVGKLTGTLCDYQIILDPLFWQSLGKALGWNGLNVDLMDIMKEQGKIIEPNEWRVYANEFFDLILAGGDTEKFWKDLLAD